MATDNKLTITMSETRPITIVRKDWPLIAHAEWYDGHIAVQSNEEAWIKVRKHTDGRTIVYGIRDRGPGGMPLGYEGTNAGWLLPADATENDLLRTIRRVAGVLELPRLADDTIADLPANEVA